MRIFIIIWLGQLVSLLGSGLSGFALNVWVYQQSNSVVQYVLLSLFATLPSLLFAPLAGVVADKWNRRQLMIFSDAIAGISSLVLLILFTTGHLQVWQLYLASFINFTGSTFQYPAYIALTSQLVPKQSLVRAAGLQQIAFAGSTLLAPVIAGVLLTILQLSGILLIDGVTCLIAVVTLLVVRLPRFSDISDQNAASHDVSSSTRTMLMEGINYLKGRTGLLWLFLFLMGTEFLMGMITILFTPLVLTVTSAEVLGLILSFGGIGMLLGGVMLSIRGNSHHPMNDVMNFTLLSGLCILVGGLKASVVLYGVCVFLFMFSMVVVDSSGQVLVQRKAEPSFQGRLFALKSAMQSGITVFSYAISGFLADGIFEPLMQANGLLAITVGRIIGTGEGRGISLMFVLSGIFTLIATGMAYRLPRLRNIEKELPDWDK